MPQGHVSRKRNNSRKKVEHPIDKANKMLARYAGLISRIQAYHKLEGDTTDERFESVVTYYKELEERKRNRKPAF